MLIALLAALALSPPVVKDTFTPLPCPKNPQTTLELEGCAEQRILATDAKINAVAKTIFGRLQDDAAKRHFIAAQKAWVSFRKADCTSVGDKYEGGTLAGVVAAQCTADRSTQRLKELRSFDKLLRTN